MTSASLSETYWEQAAVALDEARHDSTRGAYGMAVRRSQEAVELSLKALLRKVGIEVPKLHDVGEVLLHHAASSPGLTRQQLDRTVEISERLAGDRIPAFYGDEKRGLGPNDLYDEQAARSAIADADWVLATCRQLEGSR